MRFVIDGPSIRRTALLATTALMLSNGFASARVGVTSATDGSPLGKPPTEVERVLRIGIDVQANELITTSTNDRAHLVFLDGSSLTVGPNARLTVDRFVYDPGTQTGDLAITATKGVFRLVGGKISKTTPIVITTPSSTIGIRGGITLCDVLADQSTCTFVFGKSMTVSAAGRTQTVTSQGFKVTTLMGMPPGRPQIVPPGGYSGQIAQLEGSSSSSGSSGAGKGAAADQKAVTSGFSTQNSTPTPAQASARPAATSVSAAALTQSIANSSAVNTALSNTTAEEQAKAAAPPQQPDSGPTPPPTQTIVTRGRFSQQPAYTNFNNQTLGATPVAANNLALMPTGTLSNGTATIALSDGRSFTVPWQPGGAPYAISLTHPILGDLQGTGYVTASGDFFYFTFVDSSNKRLGFAGGTPTTLAQFPTSGFAAHVLTTPGSPAGTLPFASPTVNNDAQLKAAATVSPLLSVYSPNSNPVIGGPTQSTQVADAMQATVAISGVGSAQKSYIGVFIGDYYKDFNTNTTFNSGGYSGTYRGAANQTISRLTSAESTFDVGGAQSIFGPNAETIFYSPNSNRSSITTSGGVITGGQTTVTYQASLEQPYNNRAGVDYRQNTLATKIATPASLGASRTSQNMTGYVGGIVEGTSSTGTHSLRTIGVDGANPGQVFLQTNATANRVFASITVSQWDGSSTSATFNLGGTAGGSYSTQVFLDDKTYALRDRPTTNFTTQVASVTKNGATSTGTDIAARTNMVSYGAAPVANFFAGQGVTPCTCDFMTWGWWSGQVGYTNNSVYNPGGIDRLNLASYVAGSVTPSVNMPQTGTATFTGHAIGNVQNGSSAYVAAGILSANWNFAAGNGSITIGNFDGMTYNGSAAQLAGAGPSQFNGTLAGGGRTGNLKGSFFDAGSDRARGIGGSFNITGTNYRAGGTFAGQR